MSYTCFLYLGVNCKACLSGSMAGDKHTTGWTTNEGITARLRLLRYSKFAIKGPNPDLTNYGQNAYFWTGQGCGRVSAGRQISKNSFKIFLLQKHEKSKKSKNRLYFDGPPNQSAETQRLFLDFVLSRIS
jgi:hypothetical protein